MSEDYHNIDIANLKGKMREVTNPIYVPNPEELELDQIPTLMKMLDKLHELELDQIPTLMKMLDKLHFDFIEKEAELDILKSQIIAINCAISAMEKVKNKNTSEDQTKATPL